MIGHTLEFTVPLRGVIFGVYPIIIIYRMMNGKQASAMKAETRSSGIMAMSRTKGTMPTAVIFGMMRGYVGGDVLGSLDGGIYHGGRSALGRQVQARLRRRLEAATPAMNRPVGRRIGRACGLARRE